ncbi:hypothetical protein EDC96DRAFT_101698 [Choanephora cucurbitarum]|nr:hypothetical protein EDC96DRAFT_101698 [Choanephora cucurbitarum]
MTHLWRTILQIFRKNTGKSANNELNYDEISKIFKAKLDLCKATFDNGPQKRILDDTERRMNVLFTEIDKRSLSDNVIESLDTLSQALEKQEYTNAMKAHTQLMTTAYDKHGNWIVGLKRLIDLTEKALG